MEVHLVSSAQELAELAKIMQQLRPQYTQDQLIAQIKRQQAAGYQLAYVKSGSDVLCVAGFVVAEKLGRGKHIYIDDLVTTESSRSTGVGTFIINWFKSHCKQLACQSLQLDSGVQRFRSSEIQEFRDFQLIDSI